MAVRRVKWRLTQAAHTEMLLEVLALNLAGLGTRSRTWRVVL